MRNLKKSLSLFLAMAVVIMSINVTTFIANAEDGTSKLVISQYVEANGGSLPKGIELWNCGSEEIDFSVDNLSIQQGTNGGDLAEKTVINNGVLAAGQVMVVGTTGGDDPWNIENYLADNELGNVLFVNYNFQFSGDDALQIQLGGLVQDTFGTVGTDPGSMWGSAETVSTRNMNIALKAGIATGDLDGWADPSERFEVVPGDNQLEGFGLAPEVAFAGKTIAEARTLADGEEVTVKGIIVSTGYKTFIQDNTAGINIYVNPMPELSMGDSVVITGKIGAYNELKQIGNFTLDEKISSGNALPVAQEVTIGGVNADVEGERIVLRGVTIGAINTSGSTTFTLGQESITAFKMPEVPGVNEGDVVDVTAIGTQFKGAYQLHIVSAEDVVVVGGNDGGDDNGGDDGDNGGDDNNNGGDVSVEDYYKPAEGKTGAELKTALNDIIDGHTMLSYDAAYDALMVTDSTVVYNASYAEMPTDEELKITGSSQVKLFYSEELMNAQAQYAGGAGWNREHVWAKSHGDFGTTVGAGTDIHHLRATDVQVNSTRNNFDFDDLNEADDFVFLVDRTTDCYVDKLNGVFEPDDDVKGDVARMLFYMAVRYEEDDEIDLELSNSRASKGNRIPGEYGEHGVLETLLKWHEEDPVADYERVRNQIIYANYQGNRNPFIDHPEFAAEIWGDGTDAAGGDEGGNATADDIVKATIAEARALEEGTPVEITGVATNKQGVFGNGPFFIQDETGGTYIYTYNNYSVEEGDLVKIVGKTKVYNGLFEIEGVVSVNKLDSGVELPAKQRITTEVLNNFEKAEEFECELVEVKGATITEITKTNNYGSTAFTIEQDGASAKIFLDNRSGTSFDDVTFVVGDFVDVTGIVKEYTKEDVTKYELAARTIVDIVYAVPEEDPVEDTEAPVIEECKHEREVNITNDLVIEAKVTDNVKVEKVTLKYNFGLGLLEKATEVEMVANGDSYTATIPAEMLEVGMFTFQIVATDGVNETTMPEAVDDVSTWKVITIVGDDETEDGEFTIERVDSNTLANGTEARIEIEITNGTEVAEEATVIIALFDKASYGMVNYAYVTDEIDVDEKKTLAGGFLIPAEGDYEVKVLVWDNFDNQNPLLDTPIIIDVQ